MTQAARRESMIRDRQVGMQRKGVLIITLTGLRVMAPGPIFRRSTVICTGVVLASILPVISGRSSRLGPLRTLTYAVLMIPTLILLAAELDKTT